MDGSLREYQRVSEFKISAKFHSDGNNYGEIKDDMCGEFTLRRHGWFVNPC